MRVGRLKLLIFSAVAAMLMLSTAFCVVSYAKWSGGVGSATASANGSVGQFYVDFPYVASASSSLDPDTYYLAVERDGGVKDYYKLTGDAAQYQITGIYLEQGKTVEFMKGATPVSIKSQENSGYHGKLSGSKFTPSFNATYDFYIKDSFNTVYIDTHYSNIIVLNFKDRSVKLVSDRNSINIHAWTSLGDLLTPTGGTKPGFPGKTFTSSVESSATTAGNTQTVNLTSYSSSAVSMILNYSETQSINYKDYTVYYQSATLTFPAGSKDLRYFSFVPTNTEISRDEAKSTITRKLTVTERAKIPDPSAPISTAEDGADETTVRQVSAKTTASGSGYSYRNYVCVSRKDATKSTTAYVNFAVSGSDLSATVQEFNITRRSTDATGAPGSGTSTEFVFNSPVGKTLKDINATKPTNTAPSDHTNSNYVEGGTYIMLYFGTGDKQYYALDVEIVTSTPATFTLTATASNIDNRNQYKTGYGAPYGWYLGGEFNGIGMWDPRHATKFTKVTEFSENNSATELNFDGITGYHGPNAIDVSLEIELTAANDTVKLMRLGADGKRENGTDPTLWFIPRNIVRNYSGGTGSDGSPLFNKDMNLIVARPGTYVIHYVGNVEYKTNNDGDIYAYDRKGRAFMTKSEYYALGNRAEKLSDGTNRYAELGNWNGVVDNVYITRKGDGGVETVKVTFDPNGGTLAADTPTSVTWGQKLTKPTDPTNGEKSFGGWYTDEALTKPFDFSKPVTQTEDLTLYAKWNDAAPVTHTVTFYYNYTGAPSSGVFKTLSDIEDRTTISEPTPKPTRTGWTFDGWYMEESCSNVWDFDAQTVTADTKDLYAKWTKTYTVSFNLNGGSGSIAAQTVKSGATATKPSNPTRSYCNFVNWYTESSCTNLFDFSTAITGNKTLYAKWKSSATVTTLITSDSTNYYIVGKISETTVGWGDNGIKNNAISGSEYKFENIYLNVGDEFKFLKKSSNDWKNPDIGNIVVGSNPADSSSSTISKYITKPDNYVVQKAGLYSFYFQPNSNVVYVKYVSA